MPVNFSKRIRVSNASGSPAETQTRNEDISALEIVSSIARYAVGAVETIVTRCLVIASNNIGGDAASSSNAHAPTRNGNTNNAPRPNVKAKGGLPENKSLLVGLII